ncbi:hypothetical protein FMUAM8_36120 [Nocardia cyriacigeorgica]|nr:hypothetical protein FMUAM8_36120 [Nocardia cyriacigeorgica]
MGRGPVYPGDSLRASGVVPAGRVCRVHTANLQHSPIPLSIRMDVTAIGGSGPSRSGESATGSRNPAIRANPVLVAGLAE